jgi:extracellular elastinolytic metalloproteinase
MRKTGRAGVGRRRAFSIAVAVTSMLLTLPAGADAVGRAVRSHAMAKPVGKPYFDSRVGARRAAAKAGAIGSRSERSARSALRARLGNEAAVQVDALTGTARSIQKLNGTLTGPAAGDRAAVAMGWIRANRAALGLSAADLDSLSLSSRKVDQGSGFTYLRYRQAYRGIPTFDNGVRVNLDRAGRILNVSGSPVSNLAVPSVTPALSATEAMRALQANVDVTRAIDVVSGPSGDRRVTRFSRGDFARLVLFDGADGVRLAWHVTYRASSLALYDAVVDATTGKVLFRQNLTKFDNATQDVFPNYPGAERDPNAAKATANAKLLNEPFETHGWISTALTLTGPNAHVYTDANDDNEAQGSEEITRTAADGAGSDFVDTFHPFQKPLTNECDFHVPDPEGWPDPLGPTADCAWDRQTPATRDDNREQAGVQAFYFVNAYHDHLETLPIGFDETDGNFEGADPVEVNADDGMDTVQPGTGAIPDDDHVNNANMSTPPDGESPLMQMYLFRFDPARFFTFRNIDGDDDAGTVWHEYTHGLSNRLVTHDDGSGAVSSPHAGAMGEAWSDWYALDFLHRQDLEIDGPTPDVDIGMYTDATFTATRFEPIDCRPTPADQASDHCPGGFFTGTGGYTFGDFGNVAAAADENGDPVPTPEVHSDGEIWMQTLWDLRRALIAANAGDQDAGSDDAEQLVTQGMRLSPPEPSFLDMRNAIIAADEGLGGTHRDLIWQVFAGRGMGFFAGVLDSSDTHPVEDFHTPPTSPNRGTVAGTITSADTGLPLGGASVGFGGLTTVTSPTAFPDRIPPATSGANGRYTLNAPSGRYGDLVYDKAGWDRVTAARFTIPVNATATRNVALRRDWSSARGGAAVTQFSDDTGGPFGCGVDQLIDQSQGIGWSPFNPATDSADKPPEITSPPTATIKLPQTIDITAFGMNPSNTCGDDPTAQTKAFQVFTSSDGVHFALAKQGSFTPAQNGRLNLVAPTANSRGVRYVRLRLLSPQSAQVGESGHDFIDFSELEVFGGPRNVLPSGVLNASPTHVNPGDVVRFSATFGDPDSKITGYGWDFDGNGTVDRTTSAATTTFAYSKGGTFDAKVHANDFRGGFGIAHKTITVTKLHKPKLPKRGSKGKLSFRVVCDLSCKVTAKLKVSKKVRKHLGLKSRTVGSLKKSLRADTAKRLTIKLSGKAKRALRRHHEKSIKATLTVTVRYSDGRHTAAHRSVTVKR